MTNDIELYIYVVERQISGHWTPQSTWRMEPRLFGRFVDSIPKMLGLRSSDLRVRRTHANALSDFDFTPDGRAVPSP